MFVFNLSQTVFRVTHSEQAGAAGEVEVEVGAIITAATATTTMPRVAATTTAVSTVIVATHKGVDTLATATRKAAVSTITSQADEDVEGPVETDFQKLALNPALTF